MSRTIGRAWMPIPSGEKLGNRLYDAMHDFADAVLGPEQETYGAQIVAIRDALDELEASARQAKFAIETQMKNFGLKVGQSQPKKRRRTSKRKGAS